MDNKGIGIIFSQYEMDLFQRTCVDHGDEIYNITVLDGDADDSASVISYGDQIINLSKYKLNSYEIDILKKGLNFCPTAEMNYFNAYVNVQKSIRKIALKKYFAEKDNKSNMAFSDELFNSESLEFKGEGKLVNRPLSLQKNDHIYIKRADKGGKVVILDKSHYINMSSLSSSDFFDSPSPEEEKDELAALAQRTIEASKKTSRSATTSQMPDKRTVLPPKPGDLIASISFSHEASGTPSAFHIVAAGSHQSNSPSFSSAETKQKADHSQSPLEELQSQVKELRSIIETMKDQQKKEIKQLLSELDEENKIRLRLQMSSYRKLCDSRAEVFLLNCSGARGNWMVLLPSVCCSGAERTANE
ncbi:hypothetical protein XELAEV_18000376mg [Xenopus laevis]|uniref:Uncharacterized protein n=1 Tax=Xenopus laevis TaxID=8355 RepID=A0A974BQ69_XENLA|nr:hypothetical protein XELAEV_18000376mg [Xenopus laevis]